jgi:hypothetical protein
MSVPASSSSGSGATESSSDAKRIMRRPSSEPSVAVSPDSAPEDVNDDDKCKAVGNDHAKSMLRAKMAQLMSQATVAAKAQASEPGASSTYVDESGATLLRKTVISREWDAWLRENLALKCHVTTLVETMYGSKGGFTRACVLERIQQIQSGANSANSASSSSSSSSSAAAVTRSASAVAPAPAPAMAAPTANVSEDFTRRKSKWTLDLLNFCDEMDTRPRQIPELMAYPTLKTFREEYVARNRPLLIRAKNAFPTGWPVGEWTFDYFLENFRDEPIQVQNGRHTDPKYEEHTCQLRKTMPMHEFIDGLRNGPANSAYLTANNAAANRTFMNKMLSKLPNLGDSSDPFLDMTRITTQAFLWIGGKGTFTPCHHDQTQNLMVRT